MRSLRVHIRGGGWFSISLDGWKPDGQVVHREGIIAHWAEKWSKKKATIGLLESGQTTDETAATIHTALARVSTEAQERCIAFATDSASACVSLRNHQTMSEMQPILDGPHRAQIPGKRLYNLQGASGDRLPADARKLLTTIRAIPSIFCKSSKKWKSYTEEFHPAATKICQPCDTRFDSHARCLSHVEQQKDTLRQYARKTGDIDFFPETHDALLTDMISVIDPLCFGSKKLEGETNVSAADYIPAMDTIKADLHAMKMSTPDGEVLKKLSIDEFQRVYDDPHMNRNFLLCCSLLDPRFKRLPWNSAEQVAAQETLLKIGRKILGSRGATASQATKVVQEQRAQVRSFGSRWHSGEAVAEQTDGTTENDDLAKEILQYMRLPPVIITDAATEQVYDPMKGYWMHRQAEWPNLSFVARTLLGVVSGSCSCERLFSRAKFVLTRTRNRLSACRGEMLVLAREAMRTTEYEEDTTWLEEAP